jgi:hypothetical protein
MGVGRTMRRRMPERLSGAVVVAAATAAVGVSYTHIRAHQTYRNLGLGG